MKGEKILLVLDLLGKTAMNMADLFVAINLAGYGASPHKIDRVMSSLRNERSKEDSERVLKQKLYNLLHYLEKEGLITSKSKDGRKWFAINMGGRAYLAKLLQRKQSSLPSSRYASEESDRWTIVTFDIPERERRKRDWLRATLRHIDMKKIQKSVWMGKIKIPRELIQDLSSLRLIDCVEIFEITKTGSLRHLL